MARASTESSAVARNRIWRLYKESHEDDVSSWLSSGAAVTAGEGVSRCQGSGVRHAVFSGFMSFVLPQITASSLPALCVPIESLPQMTAVAHESGSVHTRSLLPQITASSCEPQITA